MGETPDQIEQHIYEKRNELGENIHELEEKVKTAFDWRAQFDQRPMLVLGAAFGGGILLSILLGRVSRRSYSGARWRRESRQSEYRSAQTQDREDRGESTWNNIRGALLAVGTSRLGSLIEEVLPGFQEQLRKRQQERGSGQHERRYGSSRHNGPETPKRQTLSGETDYIPQS